MNEKLRQDPVNAVIGQNMQRIRREGGLNSDELVRRLATEFGFELTTGQLCKLESGHLRCWDRQLFMYYCLIFHKTSADDIIFTEAERKQLIEHAWSNKNNGIFLP